MKNWLAVTLCAVAVLSSSATASAAVDRPPACAEPTAPKPLPLKPTTVDTVGQGYFCLFTHYAAGAKLNHRDLLTGAFAGLTRELHRRGLDRTEKTPPSRRIPHGSQRSVPTVRAGRS
ncbi:hypothetical protein AB0K48_51110, partial [Nonomuraea sp. NPDC055795]